MDRLPELLFPLVVLAPLGGAYALVLAAVAAVLARIWDGRGARAFLVASALALAIFTVAVLAFEAMLALWREGASGGERRGESRERFLLAATAGFAALHAAVIVAALGVAHAVAGRLGTDRRRNALAVLAGFGPFLALAFYPVEFLNACFAGEPLVWPSSIACG